MKNFIKWVIIVNLIPLFAMFILEMVNANGDIWLHFKQGWMIQITLAIGAFIVFCAIKLLLWLFD